MIRKLTGFVLAAVLLLALLPGSVSAASTQCTWYSGTNINYQNYTAISAPIESYFVQTGSDELMRLQARAVTGQYLVEYYDTAYNLLRTVTVPAELGLFGGHYYDGSNHYILSGQNNPEESSEIEVYRLTKYDKSWNRLGSVGLYGANTCGPFSAGSARIDGDGTYLFVRTCHVMYASSDGLHHQANVTIQFNTKTMTVVDSFTGVMNISYGYVSHSFNQFMKLDNGYMVGVDHGDAYPRSVVLCKYVQPYGASGFTKSVNSVVMLPISGDTGANATGVSVGGFEVTDSSYVAAGNSVDMGDGYNANAARNIFVSSVPRDLSANAEITWLTDYTDADIRPSTPHLVKLGGNSLLLLWTYNGKLYYCKLDGAGNVTSQIYEAEGSLSDCVPTLVNGKVIWYTWNNEVNTFYSLDAAHPETLRTEKSVNGHQFDVTYATETNPVASQTCRVCGHHESFTTLDEFYLWWWKGGSGSSGITRTPTEGDSYWVSLRYTAPADCENTELELLTSDPTVMEVDGLSFHFLKAGTVTLTVQAKYRPSVKQVVTFTVQHDYEEEIFSNPTCTTPGSHRLTCRICGDVKTEEMPPLGHNMEITSVTPATETNPYMTEHQTCTVCGHTESKDVRTMDAFYLWWWQGFYGYYGITETPTEGDSYEVSLRYVAPDDCENTELELLTSDPTVMAVDGYSFHFLKAGTVTLTVQAKYRPSVKQVVTFTVQHNYEEEIISNPTCTTPGSHRLTCRICGDVKTEETPPLGHNMEVTSVTPATEANPYMKEFSTCTVCGHTESRDVRTMDEFYLWWWQGFSGSSGITKTPNEGDSYEVSLRYIAPEACENTELELLTSDPTVMEVDGYSFRFVGAGTVTLTVRAKYRPSTNLTVTFDVQHILGEATYIAPTCTQPGSTSRTCSVCHQVITDVEPALGHAWNNGVVTKEPSETSEGVKTYACERCHETKAESLPKTPCPSAAFTDVNPGKWYHAGIDYVVSNGYMSGLSATTFGVNGQLTRAQFVTILYSVAGKPSVTGVSNPFTDVKNGKWYTDAVLWAVSEGITGGTSATTFSPDDTVTRAQIAMFLYAYAGKPAVTGDVLSGFADAGQIPSYARTAMNWAVSEGLISGTDATHVSPKTVATRAQIAAIIMNFVEK